MRGNGHPALVRRASKGHFIARARSPTSRLSPGGGITIMARKSTRSYAGVNETVLDRPLTTDEMDAIRRAVKDEGRLGRELWQLLRKVARNVPFAPDALAAWFCARDPATPTKVKAILLGAVAYFVLPLDVIPDVLPFLGFTDDAAVIGAALAAVATAIKPEHREAARKALDGL
jgi:uncharacterized membrane protein YkvA (DUF1232 family)